MPRRTEGTQPDSLYPTLEALADDEISHFFEKLEAYVWKGLYGYLANLTIVTDAWFAALKEIQHVAITMEWWLNNGWIRVFPKSNTADRHKSFTYALEQAYCKHTSSLNLYGLWQMWQTPLIQLVELTVTPALAVAPIRAIVRAWETERISTYISINFIINLMKHLLF